MSLLSTIKTSLDKFFLLLSSKQPSAVCPGEGDDDGGSCIETVRTRGDDDDDEPELPVSYMPYYVVEGVKVFQGMDELRDYQSAVAISSGAFKESADAIDPNSFNKDVQGTFHKFWENRHPRMEMDAPSACRVIQVHDGANDGRTPLGD